MSTPSGSVVADLDEAAAAGISDEERIARHLRKNILEQITGESVERVKRDFPSDRFFAGALSPQNEDRFEDRDDDLQSKMQPSAIGATVKLDDDSPDDELVIGIHGSVWIRVNPTFEEVQNREAFVALGDVEDGEEDEGELLPVFERLELSIPEIRLSAAELREGISDQQPVARERVSEALASAFEAARERAIARDDIFLDPGEDEEDGVPQRALEDEAAYGEYLDAREGQPAVPNWQATLEVNPIVDRESEANELIVDIELANTAGQSHRDVIHNLRDPTLFEVSLDLQTEGELTFVPYTFDPLPQDFRYNRDLWGHGRNCTIVEPGYREGQDADRTPGRRPPRENPTSGHLETRFLPQFRQLAYETADRGVEASFEILAELEAGGYDLLDEIAGAMQDYHREAYDDALREYEARDDWNRDGRDEEDFEEDRAAFAREIQRFERGVRCLRDHPDTVGRAFELMNETMDNMHEFDSWHLFQLVFIVMLVPDIASREYPEYAEVEWREDGETGDRVEDAESALDVVDVLWFPTGGGKTEAFLGLSLWNMFFDRIRGKFFGVTTWTKFPLRLLSLQQLQRMTETIMHADLVRREQDDIGSRPSRPFSVGFLVGKRNTPNALTGYNNDNAERYRNDESLREDAKVIPICPSCESMVRMRVTDDLRLAHYCTGSEFDCDWQGRSVGAEEDYAADELPVHVVDNELYRYAPSILAGTIDKITAIGYQRKMAHLITGRMEYECPIHGFASLGECTEKYGCSIDRDEFVDLASPLENEAHDLAPSLVVPDELHLLEESVGSFDGHYETGVDTLQQLVNAGRTKVLAPTATITAFEDQVYHLFLRPAERFPAPGPFLRENFYAVERPRTQRYYVGIIPHGKTHINAIIDLLYYFHFEIQTLIRTALQQPEALLDGSALQGTDTDAALTADTVEEVLESLLRYSTSLTYLLSRKEGDRLDQSIVSQLENYLSKDDRPGLEHRRMTGGTPFDVVQEILDQLEEPWQEEHDRQVLSRLVDDEVVDEAVTDDILELRQAIEERLDEEVASTLSGEELLVRLEAADDQVTEGLAWLLASRPNTVTATSMISHGVDVERFNYMLFFGMPRQTAEYIQSSSRAGRQHPGLIFTVFHPIRERDLSHYHFFEKYHEFLDRLVEPVAINRWAKNSGRRTHPGLFMGLLLNHYMYEDDVDRLFFGEQAKDLLRQLPEEEVEEIIATMYGGEDLAPEEFIHQAIADTERAIQQIQQDDSKWTSDRMPEDPMRSLRDVDEQLPIDYQYPYRDVFETLDAR